ncbi:hypothetical protein I3843_14G067300, partial [Carya illinoinensis]
FQGLGCLPIKAVRELGSKHRETIWSISSMGIRALRGPFPINKINCFWYDPHPMQGGVWAYDCGLNIR